MWSLNSLSSERPRRSMGGFVSAPEFRGRCPSRARSVRPLSASRRRRRAAGVVNPHQHRGAGSEQQTLHRGWRPSSCSLYRVCPRQIPRLQRQKRDALGEQDGSATQRPRRFHGRERRRHGNRAQGGWVKSLSAGIIPLPSCISRRRWRAARFRERPPAVPHHCP